MEAYLNDLGYRDLGSDPRKRFFELEESGAVDIERFMEFAWAHRNRDWRIDRNNAPPGYISGLRIESPQSASGRADLLTDTFWDNLLYHGIGDPLISMMHQCFFEDGKGWKDLRLSRMVGEQLSPGDLVLNLNYDTVFELALEQLERPFSYSPTPPTDDQVSVCKPHGSLNMAVNANGFGFGTPDSVGVPPPPGFRSHIGLLPPRINKKYQKHPIAEAILAPARSRRPSFLVMWGVGLANGDIELLDVYRFWAVHAPAPEVAERATYLFLCGVEVFRSATEWVSSLA